LPWRRGGGRDDEDGDHGCHEREAFHLHNATIQEKEGDDHYRPPPCTNSEFRILNSEL
jgi:hypothetical protein